MSEILKRVITLFLCIAVALGIFTNVYADSGVLRITAVEISSKSETADVETPSISNNQVQGGVVFNVQDDYAEYLFTIENTDEYAYRIDSIEDNNPINALSITYSHDEKVAAGATAHATMRLTYSDLLLNQEAVDISDLQIQIHFIRINEKQVDPEDNPGGDSEQTIDVNPNTNDGVTIFAFGSSVALFVAMFALRNVLPRKLRIAGDTTALVLAGSAIGIYAVRAATIEEIDVNFSNIHLASVYEEYTVNVDSGNGPVSHQVIYGTPLSDILVRPTKTGYHFDKWVDANGAAVSESGIVTGPMDITVNMAPNQYRVVFHGNNGTDASTTQNMTYDVAANLVENSFAYAGYKFDGWAENASGDVVYADKAEVSNLTTGTNDVDLYAKWSKRTDIKYVVRHSYEKLMEDGYTNEDTDNYGSIGVDYSPELQPRTGYETPERKTQQIAADGSTIIEYVYDLERKTLSLSDADYIETQTPAGEYKYGYPISLTAKEREGYDFLGWKSGNEIVSESATYSFEIKSDTTLAPDYEKKKFTVVVDPNNGTQATTHNNVEYGTAMSTLLPEQPSKTGHSFVNWTDASSNVVTGETTVKSALTVTANYQANTYNVVFNANGGTGEMPSQSFTYGQTQALTENAFSWDGYAFDGWATSADGNKVYEDKAEVSNLTTGTDDVLLYAKWNKRTDISYVVTHRYQQAVDGEAFDIDLPDDELEGSIDTQYSVTVRPKTGFQTPNPESFTINADGSTHIYVDYYRITYNLGLNETDYIETATPAGEYRYDYPISLTAKSREGYDFTGWSNGSTIVSTNTTYNFNIQEDVTLAPTYARQYFDVTINYNNGSAQEVKNVEYGTILSTILTEPSKTGYHFTKWVDNDSHDIDTSGAVTSAMTVNAAYEANKYHVVFNANSNSATGNMPSQEFTYSETKNLTENAFSWDGYVFDGWATSADGEVVYTDGQSVSNLTTGTEDINLYAKWHKLTDIHYAVLHRYQEVTGDGYEEVTKDYYDGDVERLIEPILFPKESHETPQQQSDHIASDGSTVFTYTYPRKVCHLTLQDADYVTTDTPEGDYRYGREISLTAKEREGYDFVGWKSGDNTVSENATYSFEIHNDVTLKPEYSKKKFTVTVDPNNGTQATTHNNVEYGTAMSELLPEQPSKTGHSFVSWTDASSNVVTGETTVTGAMTVTANYQPNTYHVVFNPNGATGEMASQSFVYGVSQNLTQNAFSRAGYIFDGWATSADGDVVYTDGQNVSNLTTGTEDVNLYAKWHKRTDISYVVTHRFQQAVDGDAFDTDLPDDELQGSVDTEYTVTVRSKTGFQTPSPEPFTINADGTTHIYVDYYRTLHHLGLGNAEFIQTETPADDYRYEYPISLTAIDREGYDFLGWHNGTEIVSTNTTYSFNLTEDVTLEPRYQIQSFTVTVDKSDGSAVAEYTLDYGTSLGEYLVEPSVPGYHVDRWMNGGQAVTSESTVKGPMTIVAILAANKYNVVYNANGGTGSMDSQQMTYGVMDVLNSNEFTRPGYNFDGWATSADGNVVYTDEQDVVNMTAGTDDVPLYAKWSLRTDIPYTVYHRYENVDSGFTQVVVNAQGSIDTDITPETAPEEGFGEPVADANTPIPGQIQLDGTSFFIYNYYRQTHQLTINDYQYVVTDTYSGAYKHGKEITLQATDRVAYEFAGWQKVTSECEAPNCEVLSTEQEYTFELTEDITIVPVYNYTSFYYVFKHDGECKIDGGSAVEGDDCGLHPELGYVDTGVKLYDEDNYNLDYEIGFTIKSLDSEQVDQATFVNAKYENSSSSAIGTGLVLRKGGQQALEVSHAVNGSKQSKQHGAGAGTTVKIVRFNGAIYYSINGGTLTLLQSMRNTNDYKDTVTWFGASYDAATESPWRYLKGTLTNMYIKKGVYDGDTATITLDANGGTVSPTSVRILAGKTLTNSGYSALPDATGNESLYFIDWYLDKDTWGQRVTENTVFDSDATLYARWEATQYACAVFIDNEHTEYRNSLDQCIGAVPENTEDPVEVALLLEQNPVLIEIPSTKKVILDGRGLKLTGNTNAPLIRNWGTLYLVDVELVGASSQGTVNNGTDEKKCNTSTCFLYIDGGKITSGSKQALYNRGGNVEIYGGAQIIGKSNSIRATVHNLDSGIITIKDASIESQSNNGDANAVLNSDSAGTIIIGTQGDGVKTNTPTITSTYNNAVQTAGQVYFYDGTLTAKKHAINKTSSPTATNANAITNSPEAGYTITVINDGDTSQTTQMYYTASNGS